MSSFRVVDYSGYVKIKALEDKAYFLGLKAIAMFRERGRV